MIESKMSAVITEFERRDAEALIDKHGRDAADEAFLMAIEARKSGDEAAVEHWALVATEVIIIQRVRGGGG